MASTIELPSTDCWSLKPWQKEAVERVVSRCRQTQNGFLLYHRVGSGKTLTLLSIAFNSTPGRKRKLIICPQNLMAGYGNNASDVKGLVGDSRSELKKFFSKIHVVSLQEFLGLCVTHPERVVEMCKENFVGVDEAHNIARFIRMLAPTEKDRVLQTLQRAFAGSRRIVMMTGTPIVAHQSDLTLLLSMLCRNTPHRTCPDFPVTNEAFEDRYLKLTEDGLSRRAVHQTKLSLLDGFRGIPLGIVAGAVSGPALSAGVTLVSGTMSSYLGIPIPIDGTIATGVLATASFTILHGIRSYMSDHVINPRIEKLKEEIRGTQYKTLDEDKMTEEWERYISYFDYETNSSPQHPALDFPSSREIYVSYPYSFLQAEMLWKMQSAEVRLGPRDKHALAMESMDEIQDLETFKRAACRLSDVSTDSGEESAECVWEPLSAAVGRYVYRQNGESNTSKDAEVHRPHDSEARFMCPKFEQALRLIAHYATDAYHMEDAKQERDVPHFYQTYLDPADMKQYALLDPTTNRLVPDRTRRRVVLVYPRFERTMKEFSAFLTDSGIAHVVLTEKTTSIETWLAQSYPLLEKDPSMYQSDQSPPLCAILHPDLIEGLNCTFNPALIVLDTIDGVGIQDQVHGRVLRNMSYHSGDPHREKPRPTQDADRWPKRIFQLKAVYHMEYLQSTERTLFAEQKAKFEALQHTYLGSTTQFATNMANYQASVAETTFETPLPQGSLKEVGLCRRALRGLQVSGVGRVLKKYIVDVTGFHFKSAVMRTQHELPEDLVHRSNAEQATTLRVIQNIFRDKNDQKLSEAYCASEETTPICSICDACECSGTSTRRGCSVAPDVEEGAVALHTRSSQRRP